MGIKPTSGASPRIKVARPSDGEGEAKRKAGLIECSESLLLLLLLYGGQEAATGRQAGLSGEGAAVLEPSRPRGVVFGVPGGHRP